MTTRQDGAFPLSYTVARGHSHVTVINVSKSVEDVYGLFSVEGALLSYPNNLACHNIITDEQGIPENNVRPIVGYMHHQKCNFQLLNRILGPSWTLPGSKRVIVVGPPSFNTMVADVMLEMGADNSELQILPSDRYIEIR